MGDHLSRADPFLYRELPPRLPARDAQLASLHAAAALARSVAMGERLRMLLWGCLQAVGLFRDKTPIPVDPATGLPRLKTGLLPLYERWFAESLAVLKDFFHRDGHYLTVGVNLYLHPISYIGLCNQRMLSVDGRCKSFGKGGNGYVPGEGVGVVLLKLLARAIADGDHIHAVIRGTSINHGGKTNGYTVPNPHAQGALIREALDKAGVHARAVSYIEAHGTGTDLGDPIEITGLNQAFQTWTRDTGFCAIGPVKSNIGHLEAAAGVAGLTKVVLQMQHGLLVPTLHVDELNPNINFATSPFLVQREPAPWRRPQVEIDGVTREYGRIAGVSSFGAGGANAHVILEEYREPVRHAVVWETGDRATRGRLATMVVLSARKAEQLHARARQLLHTIMHRPLTDADLASLAYTLQVGREAMDERLALTASTLTELAAKLQIFVAGTGALEGLVRGQVEQAAVAECATDKGTARRIDDWLKQGQIAPLLGLWVKGFDLDWHRLYDAQRPRRMDLLTYPFAGRRFWLPGVWDRGSAHKPAAAQPAAPQPVAPEAVAPATQQPVHVPVTLPPWRQAATAEGGPERPRARVTLVPPASVAGTGETVIRHKPHGIVLRPLTVAQPTDAGPTAPPAQSHVALTPVATPEPVTRPEPVAADAGRAATIPPEILREALVVSLAEALFLEREEVVLDKPFTDLGLDSIVAVEWVRALNTRYGTRLTVTRVYDHPTILALAAFLERELGPRALAPMAESISLDEVLQRVQQGHLDIAQAYQLLQQLDAQGGLIRG